MSRPDPADANRKTVQAYDVYAETYAKNTAEGTTPTASISVERFIAEVRPGGHVLEVASGPGWDADRMEAHGLDVRRTDASQGFIAVQAKRGKTVEALNLIADDLGGPYDGLVALYVMQHIPRDAVDGLIGRMAAALEPGGVLLLSFQDGEGESVENGASGDYHVMLWPRETMLGMLASHGLKVEWERADADSDLNWLSVIARRI